MDHFFSGTPAQEQQFLEKTLSEPPSEVHHICWEYTADGIVLGRSQKPTPALLARAKRVAVEPTQRRSGGGVVLAGPCMLSITCLLPTTHALARSTLPESFELLGKVWLQVLRELGIETEMVSRENKAEKRIAFDNQDVTWACFADLSYGELTDLSNRKLLGLAQVRRKHVIAMMTGLLLHRPDWELMTRVWLEDSAQQAAAKMDRLTTSVACLSTSNVKLDATQIAKLYTSAFNSQIGR